MSDHHTNAQHRPGPGDTGETARGLPTTGPNPTLQAHLLKRVVEELQRKYGPVLDAELIRRTTAESFQELDRTSRLKTFLAVHSARLADDRLHARAVAEGLIEASVPRILFVCPSNTGRSQIAAALTGRYGSVAVRSGAISPGGHLHHRAIQVLSERGIDLSAMYPKAVPDEVMRAAEYVVAIDTADDLHELHGAELISWTDVPRLSDKPIEEVREIVELIDSKTRDLVEWLTVRPTESTAEPATSPAA